MLCSFENVLHFIWLLYAVEELKKQLENKDVSVIREDKWFVTVSKPPIHSYPYDHVS